MSSIYSYTDADKQAIDVYLINGNVGITLSDLARDKSGPIVWLTPKQAQKLSDALRDVSAS